MQNLSNPLDIFNESLFTPQEIEGAKTNAVEADRHTPAVNEIKIILNRIIETQAHTSESWDVLVDVLKAFPEEVRTYIYKQSMK